ncbi:Protein root UVB sensitive 6 [Asimina triloba]
MPKSAVKSVREKDVLIKTKKKKKKNKKRKTSCPHAQLAFVALFPCAFSTVARARKPPAPALPRARARTTKQLFSPHSTSYSPTSQPHPKPNPPLYLRFSTRHLRSTPMRRHFRNFFPEISLACPQFSALMAPLRIQQSPASSQDARLLVRETMRLSANLASAPPSLIEADSHVARSGLQFGLAQEDFVDSSLRLLCSEEIDGRRWSYVAERDGHGQFRKGSIRAIGLQAPEVPFNVSGESAWQREFGGTEKAEGGLLTDFQSMAIGQKRDLLGFVRSYVVPEGFPDSVVPSYVPYMTWRALKHFFGGAMGVFTTRSLLASVGVSRNTVTPGAIAINWILKDGAGRVGKMLFARQGKKFDYDLKQLRFTGDLLLELGAGIELATAAAPHLFLPLACIANVVKNVAAVTSTSTRTPIYKAFAKGENIGDVTAKGECVGNIADLLGTGLSIMLSKRNPSLVATFALLSCGYLMSSYQEVRSVVLHSLNKPRFTVAVESFLKTGHVPSLKEGNLEENIISVPWSKDRPIVLGTSIMHFYLLLGSLQKEKYIVTYNPSKDKVYALLKDQAKSDDILKAAFHANVLLHFIRASCGKHSLTKKGVSDQLDSERLLSTNLMLTAIDFEAQIRESCDVVSNSYGIFKWKAAEQLKGWTLDSNAVCQTDFMMLDMPGQHSQIQYEEKKIIGKVRGMDYGELGCVSCRTEILGTNIASVPS